MRRSLGRYWFPLAALAVLLPGVPALVLTAADLAGRGADADRILEERLGLTHTLRLAPWAALALLIVPALLILLYFLKLRRTAVPVPSTFLWKKSVEDMRVNSFLQWLRRNVLLLLQLLVLCLMVYAALDPRRFGGGGPGEHYVLMIDNSASMAVRDAPGGLTRLGWSKRQALNQIEAAGAGDVGLVIVFNSRAQTLQIFTDDKAELRRAVESIGQTPRPTRVGQAMALAEGRANPTRSTENEAAAPQGVPAGQARTYVEAEGIPTQVHLYSDGRFDDLPDFALTNLYMNYHRAGAADSADNVGVVNLTAVRDDSGAVRAAARLLNAAPAARKVTLRLDVSEGGAVTSTRQRDVELPGRGEDGPGGLLVRLDPLPCGPDAVLHARLVGHKDGLPIDDAAWLVLAVARKANVLIATAGNRALRAFFDAPSTRRVADVTYITPGQLGDREPYLDRAQSGEFDLVVFDRCAPAAAERMPRANTFLIGRPRPPADFASLEKVTYPEVQGWSDRHPVMRGLTGWQSLQAAEAFRLPGPPPRGQRLIEAERNLVLLAARPRRAFTDLVLAFPLLRDDGRWNTPWFLRRQFPLFMRNVLFTLGRVQGAGPVESVRPGEPRGLTPPAGVDAVSVTDPAGGRGEVPSLAGRFVYGDTDAVGVYRAAWDGGGRAFAANLFDESESDIAPRGEVRIGAEAVAAGAGRPRPQELWKWFVAAGLALLLLEWFVYNRRVYV